MFFSLIEFFYKFLGFVPGDLFNRTLIPGVPQEIGRMYNHTFSIYLIGKEKNRQVETGCFAREYIDR